MTSKGPEALVVAAMAASGGVLGEVAAGDGVAGTVAGGLVPVAVQAVRELANRVQSRRVEKMGLVLEAAGVLDPGVEIFNERHPRYDERLELLGRVMEAAGRSATKEKLRALSRVLRDGLSDGGDMGEALVLAAAVAVLEPPHVVLLQYLDDHREPPPSEAPPGGKPRQGWQAHELAQGIPELAGSLDALLAVIGGQGLAREMRGATWADVAAPGFWSITSLGQLCLFLLNDGG